MRCQNAARAAIEAVLVVCIGLQGAAMGGLIAWAVAFDGVLEGAWLLPVCAATGAALASFVAGWWVLGGWRGGLRALAVVLLAGAGFGGTLFSPIAMAERLLPVRRGLAATVAGFGAAAMGGIVLTAVAPPRRRVEEPRPAPPGARPEPDA